MGICIIISAVCTSLYCIQSYIDQYCYELRARLRVFDGEFKPKIEDGRSQLKKV